MRLRANRPPHAPHGRTLHCMRTDPSMHHMEACTHPLCACLQAYSEWVPVRGLRHDRLDLAGCHRTLRFGDLVTLVRAWLVGYWVHCTPCHLPHPLPHTTLHPLPHTTPPR